MEKLIHQLHTWWDPVFWFHLINDQLCLKTKVPHMKIVETADSVDLDKEALNELPHLDQHY